MINEIVVAGLVLVGTGLLVWSMSKLESLEAELEAKTHELKWSSENNESLTTRLEEIEENKEWDERMDRLAERLEEKLFGKEKD